VALAKDSPEDFLAFVHKEEGSDLLIAHRLLAQGLGLLAPSHPEQVAEYVLGDSRRLATFRRKIRGLTSLFFIRFKTAVVQERTETQSSRPPNTRAPGRPYHWRHGPGALAAH